MTISLVSNGQSAQLPIEIETNWYIMLNMAMLIFSATFIVHANCFINAVSMYLRHSRRWIHKFHLFQTGCAVACHLCRISDYFWATDCHFKGYLNYVSYCIGLFVMDGIHIWKFNSIISHQPYKFPKLIKWFNIIFFGYFSILTKFVIFTGIIFYMEANIGVATFCAMIFPPQAFMAMIGIDVVYHLLTMSMAITLIFNQYRMYKAQYPTSSMTNKHPVVFIQQIGLNEEIYLLLVADVVIIVLFALVFFNATGVVNPEVFFQVKWATHTKCISEMVQRHTRSKMDHYTLGGLGSRTMRGTLESSDLKKSMSISVPAQDSVSTEPTISNVEDHIEISSPNQMV